MKLKERMVVIMLKSMMLITNAYETTNAVRLNNGSTFACLFVEPKKHDYSNSLAGIGLSPHTPTHILT